MKLFLLKCPKCKQSMNYHTKTTILASKRKQCVYCGKGFKISENIIKKKS